MPGPSDQGPVAFENPVRAERCPRCGKLTRRWYYLSVRIWIACEHCGFADRVPSTPVAGSAVSAESRTPRPA